MYELVSIGSLTIDLYFHGESLTVRDGRFDLAYGGKYYVDHFHESIGGGAANVAIGVSRMGVNVTLKTTIGDDGFRTFVEERLQKEHISYLHSHFEKSYQSISCILLTSKGEKTVVNYRTPHQHIFSSDRDKNGLLRTQVVFFANLTDVSFTEKVETMQYFKKNKKFIIANLGAEDCRRSREQIQALLANVDILIVNQYEYADLMKLHPDKIPFNSNLYYDLKIPSLKVLLVTQDKHGSHGYTAEGYYYQAAIEPPQLVDSTGAGDAYSAGFIASYLKDHNVPQAMEVGAKLATATLTKIGAT